MCFFLSVSILVRMTCHFLVNCVKTLSCSAISPFFSCSPQLLCPVQSLRALGLCTVSLLTSHFTYRFPVYFSLLALGYFLLTVTSYTCLCLIHALAGPPAFQTFLFNFIQEVVVRGNAGRTLDAVAHFAANLQCYFGQVISSWVLFVFCPLRI